MNDSYFTLSDEELQSFQGNGYLLVRGFFTSDESKLLQKWASEVHDLPCTPDAPWMPYQEVNSEGKHVLCRTENFANSHAGFNGFLRGKRATSLLNQLAGEDMVLFKEKINYKLSGSGTENTLWQVPETIVHMHHRWFRPSHRRQCLYTCQEHQASDYSCGCRRNERGQWGSRSGQRKSPHGSPSRTRPMHHLGLG